MPMPQACEAREVSIGRDEFAAVLDRECGESDLILVDQHTAHERSRFERLQARLAARGAESQLLLSPAVFGGAIVGASLGFLWYNAYPAQLFMGDTGSLALGAAVATLAVLVKNELLLLIVGGVFVAEAVSVIMQVFSYRTTGRRVFRMAPIHHHFEKLGWQEPKIVVRFWIVSIVLALIALSSLKLR